MALLIDPSFSGVEPLLGLGCRHRRRRRAPLGNPYPECFQLPHRPRGKAIALIGIIGAAGVLIFQHAEMNMFVRFVTWIVLVISCLVGANAFLNNAGATAAEITSNPKPLQHEVGAAFPRLSEPWPH